MKKSLLTLLFIMLLCLSLASCKLNFGGGNVGGGGGNAEVENLIFDSKSELYIALSEDADWDLAFGLQNAIDANRGKLSSVGLANTEPLAHEIVIGKTDRPVSVTAYERLARIEKKGKNDVSWLIYSDGSSVAIAYDFDDEKAVQTLAVEYFENKYANDQLILAPGVVYSETFDLIEDYYRALDNAHREAQWAELKKHLDPSYADEFIVAMKQLYSIYDPHVVEWLANLYEPNICVCYGLYGETECKQTKYCGHAGFYYSNSGRDTIGYLPDLESTQQSLGPLQSWGISYRFSNQYKSWLPEEMKVKMAKFAISLQDADDGFFYHPQWGKDFIINNNKDSRRARDLNHATGLISLGGLKPIYDTPNGVAGSGDDSVLLSSGELTSRLGSSRVSAVSKVILTEGESNYAPHLESVKTFTEYLESYDIRKNSYSVGNRVGSQMSQIQARDKQLYTEDDPTPLMDTLIKYLLKNQNPQTGCWNWGFYPNPYSNDLMDEETLKEKHVGANLYETVNGLLKIGGDFTSAGYIMPYAEEAARTALQAVTDPKPLDAVTSLYNTWFAFSNTIDNLRGCTVTVSLDADGNLVKSQDYNGNKRADALIEESRGMAIEGIRASREKIAVFQKPDGSFSYGPKYSAQTSQGCQVALPNAEEGDVNATVISMAGIYSRILEALELSRYTPILFGEAERRIYLDIINNASSVKKNEVVMTGDPITFDYEDVGTIPEDLEFKDGPAPDVKVVENPKGEGNAAKITSVFGKGDYIIIPNQTNSELSKTFVFESDFLLESSDIKDDSYFVQVRMGRNNYTTYFFTLTLKNGGLYFTEHTSSSWATDVSRNLGRVGTLGEWFKIKVEFYYTDVLDEARAKVYCDDDLTDKEDLKLIAVTDTFYDASGTRYLFGEAYPSKYFDYTELYMMKDNNAVLYMDNCMTYKVKSTYARENDPANQPAYNVDSPDSPEKVYTFGDDTLPEDIIANVVGGSGSITAANGALKLISEGKEGAPTLSIPVNKRTVNTFCATVSVDINCADAKAGTSLLRFEGVDRTHKMFGLDLIAVAEGSTTYLTLREFNGESAGNILENVRIPLGKTVRLTFEYFHKEDVILIYVDEEPNDNRAVDFVAASTLMYKDGNKYSMEKLDVTSLGGAYELTLDNVKVEKQVLAFNEAVQPNSPSNVHQFNSADEDLTVSGGATVSGGVLNLNSKTSKASVSIPIHTRANLQNLVYFSAKLNFTENISKGEAYRILFNDADGKTVFALALVYDGVEIDLCQVSEGGTVSEPLCSFALKKSFTLAVEIYQEHKVAHVYEEGNLKAITSVFYNPETVYNRCASVSVASGSGKSVMTLDDLIFEEYYGAYRKQTLSSKSYPNEKLTEGLHFELSNTGKIPTVLTPQMSSQSAALRVEREMNTVTGEWSNVVAMDTGKGANDAYLINSPDALGSFSCITFESDIKLMNESYGDSLYQIFFSDTSRNNKVYMLTLGCDDKTGNITLSDNSSNSYKDDPNVNVFELGGIKRGEWFRLRVDFYLSSDRSAIRFKVSVNGEVVAVSNNFYHSQNPSKAPNTTLQTVQMMSLSDVNATLYLDNVTMKGSNDTCKDAVTVKNQPK